jgi:glyoxylase-like metal-dependent hydrolase (beta-lactamase superfamily II)
VTEKTQIQPITAQQLARMVIHQENFYILDVRNEEDHHNWKIEGQSITMSNIPYFELLDGVDHIIDRLPRDRKIVVVCAKEGSSVFVAEQLAESGLSDVYYLVGGMKSWSEHIEPVKIGEWENGGAIYQFVRIGKGCLSYMITSGGEAAIVDAARLTDVYETLARDHHLQIKYTLDTHLHADHISGGRKLAEKVGAMYWLPPKDADEVIFAYNPLMDAQELTIGTTRIQIQPVYSPGHTIGSTSLIVNDRYLLTGDILFIESIGRPDLAGKAEDWVSDLRETLYSRYTTLSAELVVLPAHFGKVTELGEGGKVAAKLGELYRNNPGLNIQEYDQFKHTVTAQLPPQPNAYQDIRQTNMGRLKPTDEEQQEMEIGPNRCAVHDK